MSSARVSDAPYRYHFSPDSKVVVRATTGLEQLVATEVTAAGHFVEEVSKRQIIVSPAAGWILTRPPRLADDVFAVAAQVPDPGPGRVPLWNTTASLGPVSRAWVGPPTFAVSASFVGRRRYSRFDIEDAVGRALSRQGVGTYVSRRDGGVPPRDAAQWRVTLDGSTMYVGPRLFAAPLHRRPWRARTVPGSLHPPVAAAMARLAGIDSHHTVVDPCCGAGTILIEAHMHAPAAGFVGRDIAPSATAIARHNSGGRPIEWNRGEASACDVPPHSVDRIITNPPWGIRQRAGDLATFLTEWHRVIRPDGLLVVLLDEAQEPVMTRRRDWALTATYPLSVAGRHPRILLAVPR